MSANPSVFARRPKSPSSTDDTNGAVGLILLDSTFRIVLYNADTVMINHFDARDPAGRAPALPPDVLVGLRRHNFARSRTYVAQSSVGGRQFSYRASMLKTNPELRSSATDAYIAVLILQGCQSESDALLEVSRRFGLTEREREAVEYLISSLSTKEIAERMEISPNTVKSFLRLAMIKLGVSNRTGILMKIFKQSEPPGEPVAKAVAASNVPY